MAAKKPAKSKQKGKQGPKKGSRTALIKKETEITDEEIANLGRGSGYADLFKQSITSNGGRPRKWDQPIELLSELAAFFAYSDVMRQRPTKAGMYLYLGTTRDTIRDYEAKPEFSDAIKSAYSIIEHAWTQRLNEGASTGAIFYLKNAFQDEYKDRTEVKGEIEHKHAVIILPPKRISTENEIVITEGRETEHG